MPVAAINPTSTSDEPPSPKVWVHRSVRSGTSTGRRWSRKVNRVNDARSRSVAARIGRGNTDCQIRRAKPAPPPPEAYPSFDLRASFRTSGIVPAIETTVFSFPHPPTNPDAGYRLPDGFSRPVEPEPQTRGTSRSQDLRTSSPEWVGEIHNLQSATLTKGRAGGIRNLQSVIRNQIGWVGESAICNPEFGSGSGTFEREGQSGIRHPGGGN